MRWHVPISLLFFLSNSQLSSFLRGARASLGFELSWRAACWGWDDRYKSYRRVVRSVFGGCSSSGSLRLVSFSGGAGLLYPSRVFGVYFSGLFMFICSMGYAAFGREVD